MVNLNLRLASASRGETTLAPAESELFHPFARTSLVDTGGFLLVLNGISTNRRLSAFDSTPEALQMPAPMDSISPTLFGPGSGRVFGNDLFWCYRWKNSDTGEVSGLSPLSAWGTNVGTEVVDGSDNYLGEKVIFRIVVNTTRPNGADTVQLFRNTTSQKKVFLLVQEIQFIIGTVAVLMEDDKTDDELGQSEQAAFRSAPDATYGAMPPVAKAYRHSNGRTMYYGGFRFGTHRVGRVTITADSSLVAPSNGDTLNIYPYARYNRIRQRFIPLKRASDNVVIEDPTHYTIVNVDSYNNTPVMNNLYVHPAIQTNNQMSAGSVEVLYEIRDDRDLREVHISDVFNPTQVDPANSIFIGRDRDDSPCLITEVGEATFAVTRKGIYRLDALDTLDPSLSVSIVPVVEEGAAGLWAACYTPMGIVYLHENLGVRLFDGKSSLPLGGSSPAEEFQPKTQLAALEKSLFDQALLYFDPINFRVVLSSVWLAGSDEAVSFSYDPGTGSWRGPHFMSRYVTGDVADLGSGRTFVTGDQHGNVIREEYQVLDLLDTDTGQTVTGTVASVAGLVFTVTAATFNPSSDYRMRGAPIWFLTGSTYYRSVVSDVVSATQIRLLYPPVDESGNVGTLAAGWTFGVGSIRWRATTAYLDAGEPIQPKTMERVRLRFQRGTASDPFTVANDAEDSGTFTTETGSAATVDPNSSVYAEPRIRKNGVTHKLRLTGTSRGGEPKISGAIADIDVHGGVRRSG